MKKILKKNGILLGVVAVAVGVVVWAGWTFMHTDNLGQDFAKGNGRIEATEIDIAAKYGGRIEHIAVNEGDLVQRDQILVQMQSDVLKAQYQEAIAVYQQSQKMVGSAEAQVVVSKSNLVTAEAVVAQRTNELDAAQRRLARSRVLARRGAASMQTLDDDQAAVRSMSAVLKAAQAQLASAQAGVLAAQASLQGVKATVIAHAANVNRVVAELKDNQLKAPCDGRVQYKIAQPGEVVGGGGKILNLMNWRDIYMTFFLPEQAVGKVALGGEVRIVLDALPNQAIPAKISFVASVAQFTPKTVETANERQKLMFRVKAQLDPRFVAQNLEQIKTGLPGVAYVKLSSQVNWPPELGVRAIKWGK